MNIFWIFVGSFIAILGCIINSFKWGVVTILDENAQKGNKRNEKVFSKWIGANLIMTGGIVVILSLIGIVLKINSTLLVVVALIISVLKIFTGWRSFQPKK